MAEETVYIFSCGEWETDYYLKSDGTMAAQLMLVPNLESCMGEKSEGKRILAPGLGLKSQMEYTLARMDKCKQSKFTRLFIKSVSFTL